MKKIFQTKKPLKRVYSNFSSEEQFYINSHHLRPFDTNKI